MIGELLRATGDLDAADYATEECYAEWTKVDMVTSYKGQTAPKVREMINDMRGGVVLIDEAYTLTDRKAGSKEGGHGIEAYDTVMNALNSQDPVFVFAGYEDKMQKFMVANPGLPRRVLRRFKLPNLDPSQLAKMFMTSARQNSNVQDFMLEHLERRFEETIFSCALATMEGWCKRYLMGPSSNWLRLRPKNDR